MAKTTTPATEPPLETLAEEINDRWHAIERGHTEARIEIGRMLLKAKEEVEREDRHWPTWCDHHIERSMADINKIMALASASNPLAALESEREKRRKQMADFRARKPATQAVTSTADTTTETVEDAHVGAEPAKPTPLDELQQRLGALEDVHNDLQLLIDTWDQASPDCKALFRTHIGCVCSPPEDEASSEGTEQSEAASV